MKMDRNEKEILKVHKKKVLSFIVLVLILNLLFQHRTFHIVMVRIEFNLLKASYMHFI